MSLMYTVSGHLTNLSYLPETERVIAGTLSASFTYTEDDGVPFGIRFNAGSSTGDITRYTWDFGETSSLVEPAPGTGATPFFGYDNNWSYGGTRGDFYGYDGRYPHQETYQVTLTATDRHGRSAARTKRVRVTNTLSFPGLRNLIGRINDRGGHRGKLVIWEPLGAPTFEDSHAKQTVFSSMGEEGVPAANIVAPIPDVPKGVADFLTHPHTRAVRNETLVVNRSVFPAFVERDVDPIAAHNIVFVGATGNVDRTGKNKCDPVGSPDRDLWRPGHSTYTCDGADNSSVYRGAMEAIATGKVLYATSANLQQDGSVIPHLGVMKCGDTMAFCFAVPYVDGSVTSSAAAKLSAAVFHLFQLYENADDVVQALKRCTRDVGEPGIDREFGNGLVDLRCVEATGSVVNR